MGKWWTVYEPVKQKYEAAQHGEANHAAEKYGPGMYEPVKHRAVTYKRAKHGEAKHAAAEEAAVKYGPVRHSAGKKGNSTAWVSAL